MTITAAKPRTVPAVEAQPTASHRSRGAVFTRRWVAGLVLDLAGYTADLPLAHFVAIEPACGPGAFVAAMAERLAKSCRDHNIDIASATGAIVAVDIDPAAVETSKDAVRAVLVREGVDQKVACDLAEVWIRTGDFLLTVGSLPSADWVVGNPPYVRIEDADAAALKSYRERWDAMTGRADLYVGFIQAGLGLLKSGGRLSFICADRWMRNQYGARLRRQVAQLYSLDACVVLHDVDAFEDRVAAYPAIAVLRRGAQGSALVADAEPTFDADAAQALTRAWSAGPKCTVTDARFQMSWLPGWFSTQGSWPTAPPDQLAVLTDLERRLPTLQDAGVEIAVGVASGADDAYLTTDPTGIESDRLLKIVSAREVSTGRIEWRRRWLVNPWDDDGLVPLDQFPGMRDYLSARKERIGARHVARNNPARWWRTLDRVHPRVARTKKLLVPDLKDRIFPVLDVGEYYPPHSLYYLTSSEWDLEALGGLLMSDLANAFVSAYSVRMASGYMRVSAQYLRRVRIPHSSDVAESVKEHLAAAFRKRDVTSANLAAAAAYNQSLTP